MQRGVLTRLVHRRKNSWSQNRNPRSHARMIDEMKRMTVLWAGKLTTDGEDENEMDEENVRQTSGRDDRPGAIWRRSRTHRPQQTHLEHCRY